MGTEFVPLAVEVTCSRATESVDTCLSFFPAHHAYITKCTLTGAGFTDLNLEF